MRESVSEAACRKRKEEGYGKQERTSGSAAVPAGI